MHSELMIGKIPKYTVRYRMHEFGQSLDRRIYENTWREMRIIKDEHGVRFKNLSGLEDGVSILDFHYLAGTPEEIDYFTERHELGLFSHEDYRSALDAAGLEVEYNPEGLMGRGLYTGVKPRRK